MTAARKGREPGYLEQLYYVLKWWWKNLRHKRQEGAKT